MTFGELLAQARSLTVEQRQALLAALVERGFVDQAGEFLVPPEQVIELDEQGFPTPVTVAPPVREVPVTAPEEPPAVIAAAETLKPQLLGEEVKEFVTGRLPAIPVQAAGIAYGVLLEGVSLGADSLAKLGLPMPPPGPGEEGEQAKQLYQLTEEEIARRLGEAWYTNLSTDIRDNIVGILDLLAVVVGAKLDSATFQQGFPEAMADVFRQGKEFGGAFVGGMVGGTIAMVESPVDSFQTMPVTSAQIFLPILRAGRAGVLATGSKRLAALVGEIDRANAFLKQSSVKAAAAAWNLVDFVLQRVFKGKAPRRNQAEFEAAIRRWVSDGLAQADENHAAIVERIVREPERVKAEIEAIAGELARKVERGEVGPDDLRFLNASDNVTLDLGGEPLEVPLSMAANLKPVMDVIAGTIAFNTPAEARLALLKALNRASTPEDHAAFQAVARRFRDEMQSILDHADLPELEGAGIISEGTITQMVDEMTAIDDLVDASVARQAFLRTQRVELQATPEGVKMTERVAGAEEMFAAAEEFGNIEPGGAAVNIDVEPPRKTWQLATLRDPAAEALVQDLTAQLKRLTAREVFPVVGRSPAASRLVERARRVGAITEETARSIIGSVLVDESVQVLRDPKFRKDVVKGLEQDFGKAADWDKLLTEMADGHFLSRPFTYDIDIPGREGVNLAARVQKAMGERPPEAQAATRAEALRRLMHEASTRLADNSLAEQVAGGINFPVGTTDTLGRYAEKLVEGVTRGEGPPAFILKFDPEQLAQYIESQRDVLSADAMRKVGKQIETAAEEAAPVFGGDLIQAREVATTTVEILFNDQVDDLVRQLRVGYTKPSDTLRGKVAENLPKVELSAVAKGVDQSLSWHYRAQDALRNSNTLFDRLFRAMKANLTVRNPSSHVNNFTANVVTQSLRLGIDPLSMTRRLTKTAKLWYDWRKGKPIDPELAATLLRIERSGVLSTSLVDGEVATMGGNFGGKNPVTAAFDTVAKKMGEAYQFGDQVFKLEETLRNLRQNSTFLDNLRAGEHLDLTLDPRREVRVVVEGGEKVVKPLRGFKADDPLPSLDEALVRASGKPALDIFFDYGDVPNYVNFLRATRAQGVVSPFFTWYFKALDLPGAKPGLLGEVLYGPHIPKTNSAALNRAATTRLARFAARRAVVLNGLKADLLHEDVDRDALAEMSSFVGREGAAVLADQLSDPLYFDSKDWSAANFAEPVDTFLRVGIRAWSALPWVNEPEDLWPGILSGSASETTDKALAELDEGERQDVLARRRTFLKAEGGKLATVKDVLTLAGLAGAPLMEAIAAMNGKAMSTTTEDIWRRFGGVLIGGIWHKALDISIAKFKEESAWSTRQWALSDDPKETEPFLRWAVRRLVGLGWRTEKFDADETPKLVGQALTASLARAANKEVEAVDALLLVGKASHDDVVRAQQKADGYARIVDDEVARIQRERNALLERLLTLPQARPHATLPGEAAPAP